MTERIEFMTLCQCRNEREERSNEKCTRGEFWNSAPTSIALAYVFEGKSGYSRVWWVLKSVDCACCVTALLSSPHRPHHAQCFIFSFHCYEWWSARVVSAVLLVEACCQFLILENNALRVLSWVILHLLLLWVRGAGWGRRLVCPCSRYKCCVLNFFLLVMRGKCCIISQSVIWKHAVGGAGTSRCLGNLACDSSNCSRSSGSEHQTVCVGKCAIEKKTHAYVREVSLKTVSVISRPGI